MYWFQFRVKIQFDSINEIANDNGNDKTSLLFDKNIQ